MLNQVKATLRRAAHQASAGAKLLFGSGIVRPIHPASLFKFGRDMVKGGVGPHAAVMFHATVHPDKEALIEYGTDGVRRLTWIQFHQAINRCCNALIAIGVGSGDPVAIMLPNGVEYLIVQQALMQLGATAVLIGYRLKASEVAYILQNAEPRATVMHEEYIEVMKSARITGAGRGPVIVVAAKGRDVQFESGTKIDTWHHALETASPQLPPRLSWRTGIDSGVLIYTSGTTGKPKGAKRTIKQTGIDAGLDMMQQISMRSDDRHLAVCPLYHSAAPAFVHMMIGLGATTVLMNHFEPERALQIIEQEKITCSFMVPTMLVRMCALPPQVRSKYCVKSLRWVMSGAAPLATETARQVNEQWGPVLWNFYGSTETGLVTIARPSEHLTRPGTIGRALLGIDIQLLNESGTQVPVGEVGELYTKSSALIDGYHRNVSDTNASMRQGYFSVGDMARVDRDGFYYLESRKNDMVISGGVNIYPREIEDHLHQHPSILEAAVIGIPNAEWGEQLLAFVVLRAGVQLTEAEVIDFCRRELADFKRPRSVRFLVELPRNPTGKVLKQQLRTMALS
jgi:fatty-acyl-CoA synthase